MSSHRPPSSHAGRGTPRPSSAHAALATISPRARPLLVLFFLGGLLSAIASPGEGARDAPSGALAAARVQAAAPAQATVLDPQAPARAASRIVWLPGASSPEGRPSCALDLAVQNLGHEVAKASLIAWGERSECPPQAAGPLKVECSGLIAPGSTWRFSAAQIPVGTESMAVISFSGLRLSQLGVDLGFDDIVADLMCETLFFGVVGDADDFARFLAAFRDGSEFAGVPMERAAGAPIAARLERRCPSPVAGDATALPRSGAVAGLLEAELGAPDAQGAFHYALPLVHAAPVTTTGSTLHIQNAGDGGCASVEITFRAQDAPDAEPCTLSVPNLVTGEAVQLDLAACAADGASRGSVIVRGSQPLAISSDLRWGESLLSVPATAFTPRREVGGGGGAAAPATATVNTELLAPVVYRDVGGWTSHVHVHNTDPEEAAAVQVVLTGRGGTGSSFMMPIPPAASRTLDLDEMEDVHNPRNWVGSLRLTSFAAAGEDVAPPEIAAVVASYRNADVAGASEALGYTATSLPARATGPARSSPRGGLLAIPSLVKAPSGGGVTSELSIANGASSGGDTDLVLFLFDANGLLDYVCQKLGPGMTEHIDFATWGAINAGFRGSAVVSATVWDRGQEGDVSAQLSAVVTHRPSWQVGAPTTDEAGDSSFAHAAVAIPESANAGFVPGGIVSRFEICGRTIVLSTPTPWPSPTPTATRTPPPGQATSTAAAPTPIPTDSRARNAYLPRLVR